MTNRRRNVDIAKTFGENLRESREKAELSQEELGLQADLHRTEISQLERGLRVPRIDTLVKLAACLDVAPGDLLDGMEWQPARLVAGGFA